MTKLKKADFVLAGCALARYLPAPLAYACHMGLLEEEGYDLYKITKADIERVGKRIGWGKNQSDDVPVNLTRNEQLFIKSMIARVVPEPYDGMMYRLFVDDLKDVGISFEADEIQAYAEKLGWARSQHKDELEENE